MLFHIPQVAHTGIPSGVRIEIIFSKNNTNHNININTYYVRYNIIATLIKQGNTIDLPLIINFETTRLKYMK